ncbi:hypothetical protein [Halomonas litopenaei]|uniref:hypothetical protein n=1 Tax=Halomonas litopenaei TaxID=2109328 RepID=UPI003F9FE1D3
MTTDLALNALLSAFWHSKPQGNVMVNSDQVNQFRKAYWRSFMKPNHPESSMSLWSDCQYNAVAESFSHLLNPEHIKCRIYLTRGSARLDVFYNYWRRHGMLNGLLSFEPGRLTCL